MPVPMVWVVSSWFENSSIGNRTLEVVGVFETEEGAEKYISEEIHEYAKFGIQKIPPDWTVQMWEVHR